MTEHVGAGAGSMNTGALYGLPSQHGNGRGTDEGAIGRVQSQKYGSFRMRGATLLEVRVLEKGLTFRVVCELSPREREVLLAGGLTNWVRQNLSQ